ncbi:MAG TPA: ABC transporter permease subunit [Bryobacteraceae bacterium]|nr:ABC transporter permease subunit [Bryobacteraceae bacterium]
MSDLVTLPRFGVTAALVADTFQEAMARWLFWALFGLSTLLILFFLFILKIDVVDGAISLLGLQSTSHSFSDLQRIVHLAYSRVALFLYVWGTFLAVFASAGLMPSVLEPGRVGLLLSKPITRPVLLMGRFLGNLLIVSANVCYLILSIWIIIGIKTGMWDPAFLLSIPFTVFVFAVLLCVVVFIGVVFESAPVAVMVAAALMLVSGILAQKGNVVKLLSSEWSRDLWTWLYWASPKVWDLGRAMMNLISDRSAEWWAPAWTSAAFGIVVLAAAIQIFRKRDY